MGLIIFSLLIESIIIALLTIWVLVTFCKHYPENKNKMNELFIDETRGASISECEKYRYKLWRIWDYSKPKAMFIMLNPSTADSYNDDPTIRRCISFAKSWGYGGIYVGNLYPHRTSDPKELVNKVKSNITNDYHVRKTNRECINSMVVLSEIIIYAWGNSPILKQLNNFPIVHEKKDKTYYLELSNDGTPKHPLYLKGDLKPKLFKKQ